MIKSFKYMALLTTTVLFIGCVPAPKPHIGTSIGVPIHGGVNASNPSSASSSLYGKAPHAYASSIKSYFSTKLKRGSESQYKFSTPKRAYKRKGLAYGGDIAWRGWLVETLVATPSRTGRLLTPKPYMVLFSGEQIVEHILGNSHKLLTKVDK